MLDCPYKWPSQIAGACLASCTAWCNLNTRSSAELVCPPDTETRPAGLSYPTPPIYQEHESEIEKNMFL